MTEGVLYEIADEEIGPYLIGEGFNRIQTAEFVRRIENGYDRIQVSRGPPSKASTHFSVCMSYFPEWMSVISGLFAHLGQDTGFPCGPYLNPVTVSRRPKYWSCRTMDQLKESLKDVVKCLRQAGLSWLQALRDPMVFAVNVDMVAVLPAGLANEVCGNIQVATLLYQEMLRRYLIIIQDLKDENEFLWHFGRPFVFVAIKLGVEEVRRQEIQNKLNFFPDIQPLPPIVHGGGSG